MAFDCVILKPCSASRAAPAWTSLSNSTKAMSWRPGTKRTSLNPGNLNTQQWLAFHKNTNKNMNKCRKWVTDWLNSMESMSSLVSSGKLVRNRMWLGGFSATWEDKGKKRSKKKHRKTDAPFPRNVWLVKRESTAHLLRHLSRHHLTRRDGSRGDLTRCHAWRGHHAWRRHIWGLPWHVHHARSLAHGRHSLKKKKKRKMCKQICPHGYRDLQ